MSDEMWASGPRIELAIKLSHSIGLEQLAIWLRQATLEEHDPAEGRWLLKLMGRSDRIPCVVNSNLTDNLFWLGVPPAFIRDAPGPHMSVHPGVPSVAASVAEVTLALLEVAFRLGELAPVRCLLIGSEEQLLNMPDAGNKAVYIQRSLLMPLEGRGNRECILVSSVGR